MIYMQETEIAGPLFRISVTISETGELKCAPHQDVLLGGVRTVIVSSEECLLSCLTLLPCFFDRRPR